MLAALALFVGFVLVVLPRQAATSAIYTERVGSPDTRFWYPAETLYAAADAWGPAGRSAYATARITFDVVWPLVYAFFLLTASGWLAARLLPSGSPWRRLALLPILVVLLDYAENACTAIVMVRYPDRTPVLADLAGIFTAAKWVSLSVSFVLVIGGVLVLLVSRLSKRSSSSAP